MDCREKEIKSLLRLQCVQQSIAEKRLLQADLHVGQAINAVLNIRRALSEQVSSIQGFIDLTNEGSE